MHQFARIFFDVHVVDAHGLLGFPQLEVHSAAHTDRLPVLGNLVTFGQVGVKVVLAVKSATEVDAAAQSQAQAYGILQELLIQAGQSTGLAQ